MVCMRFSACSNWTRGGRLEDLVGHFHLGDAELLEHVLAHLGLPIVEGGQAVHEAWWRRTPVEAIRSLLT